MNCKNLRDVCETVPSFPPGKILRGGSIDYHPKTILNLRQQPDDEKQFPSESITYIQFAKERDLDAYNVQDKSVQKWVIEVVKQFERNDIQFPVLIHCASGKDRTGVIVACLLLICDVDRKQVELDFATSKGVTSDHKQMFTEAMDFILVKRGLKQFFRSVKIDQIKTNLIL